MERNQSNHSPKRIDKIRDKLLVIEMLSHKARHLPEQKEKELTTLVTNIGKSHRELFLLINTSDVAGRKKGWWK
jgi:hypothetical protein